MTEQNKTSLERPFQTAARPGEKIITNVEMGYPGIIIGHAYVIQQQIHTPIEPSDEIKADPDYSQTELNKFKEAHRRVTAQYQRRYDQAGKLPVEFYDSTEQMIEAEQMIVSQLTRPGSTVSFADCKIDDIGEKAHPILLAIKDGKSAHGAIFEYLNQQKEKAIKGKESAEEKRNYGSVVLFNQQLDRLNDIILSFQAAINPHLKPNHIEDAPDGSIPVTPSIPVGDMIHFRRRDGKGTRIDGTVNCEGTDKDHSNIVGRSARITMAKTDRDTLKSIRNGDLMIIDGPQGRIIMDPAPETVAEYTEAAHNQKELDHEMTRKWRKTKWPRTKDGHRIKVSANTGYSDEYGAVDRVNPGKIGLHRTELTILGREGFGTTEDKWYEIFSALLDKAGGRAITIRSLDFAGDKIDTHVFNPNDSTEEREEKMRERLESQFRALLRVRNDKDTNKLHLMFPMIRTAAEFSKLQGHVDECASSLGVKTIRAGAMIETTAVIDDLAEMKAGFFSVGTNDLIPHIIDFDRYNKGAEKEYDPTDKRVISVLEKISASQESGREVSVCGDMATDPRYMAILIGTGFEHLSCGISRVSLIKELVSRVDIEKSYVLVQSLKKLPTKAERDQYLDRWNEQHLGLLPNRMLKPVHDHPPAPRHTHEHDQG